MANTRNTEEWDYVDVLPEQENPRPSIAGNYGPASNVWHIGMVSFFGLPNHEHLTIITALSNLFQSACMI